MRRFSEQKKDMLQKTVTTLLEDIQTEIDRTGPQYNVPWPKIVLIPGPIPT